MNFLSNMRISHKISALMVGLIVGFIIIGVTYYVQISFENDARVQEQSGLRFRGELAAVNSQLLDLTGLTEEYSRAPNPDAHAQLQAQSSELQENLQTLKTEIDADNNLVAEVDTITDIIQYHERYQNLLQKLPANDLTSSGNEQNPSSNLVQQQRALTDALVAIDNEQFGFLSAYLAAEQPLSDSDITRADQMLNDVDVPTATKEQAAGLLNGYANALNASKATAREAQTLQTELATAENALTKLMAAALAENYSAGVEADQAASQQRQVVQAVVTAIIFVVAMGTAVGVYFLYKSIVFPMVHMQSVIGKINRGKTGSRVKILSGDELGDLGKAFNQLLDERIKQLEERSLENDQLNNSIISLIKALGLIAQKDLTVKVPVSPDVTGTISDAVNLLTTETARTLEGVKLISEQVNAISEHLQQQSNLVIQFADGEKRQIIATAKALEILARAMNDVANHAETADASAAKAIENTQQARQSVEETVNGIRTIRETISETEKRTKRLGDRSQEISGIVNLINTIAERTHILALNASMHAASAGEAGRGFAVVADEVQRLAESARQSTDEIAAMVNNMRVETSDTVAIMNTLIAQVADGSRLAEEAGKRMTATETATQALVEDVKEIARQAVQQAEVANRVRDRSAVIRKFTDKTGKQLEEQRQQTDNLKQLADNLVDQVNVFTLPVSGQRIVRISNAGQLETQNKGGDDNISPLHAAS